MPERNELLVRREKSGDYCLITFVGAHGRVGQPMCCDGEGQWVAAAEFTANLSQTGAPPHEKVFANISGLQQELDSLFDGMGLIDEALKEDRRLLELLAERYFATSASESLFAMT